jgi:hypothetical protein
VSGAADQQDPNVLPDHSGQNYYLVLDHLHRTLKPKSYFEIGVNAGNSFAQANCPSIGVDPGFVINDPKIFERIVARECSMLFRLPSDDFFARHNPQHLLGMRIDMAFLDGMHRSEFLLRDFMNTEAHCKPNSVIALHDCLPPDPGLTGRALGEHRSPVPHRYDWWAGDVWRTALLLKRKRPDLRMTVLDAAPTGLVLITNLDPGRNMWADYAANVEDMLAWDLDKIGTRALFDELQVEPTAGLESHQQITARFWM